MAGRDEGDLGDKNGDAGVQRNKGEKRRVAVGVRWLPSSCLDSFRLIYSLILCISSLCSNTHTHIFSVKKSVLYSSCSFSPNGCSSPVTHSLQLNLSDVEQ